MFVVFEAEGRDSRYSLNDQKVFSRGEAKDGKNLKEDTLPGDNKLEGNTRTHIEHER